jgi:hypothetical protein
MKTREIKFRAWDKKEKKWTDLVLITLEGKTIIDSFGGGFDDLEDIELQQYTGIKDINGKEIYEGDIIQDWQKSGNRKCRSGHPYMVEYLISRNKSGFNIGTGETNNKEIIGNIYENPELLK